MLSLEHPGALNEDFNLSTAEETSVNELAAVIWAKINGDKPLNLVHDTPFDHDVQRRSPSTVKAKEILGFEATTSLSDMLDIVIPWIDDAIDQGAI